MSQRFILACTGAVIMAFGGSVQAQEFRVFDHGYRPQPVLNVEGLDGSLARPMERPAPPHPAPLSYREALYLPLIRERITGRLELTPRGLAIVTDAGDRWVLEDCAPGNNLIGTDVTAEGVVSGLDRLKADWVGSAAA